MATIEPVRGSAEEGEITHRTQSRVALGAVLKTSQGGLSQLRLDGGARLLLDGDTEIEVIGADLVAVRAGRLFVDVQPDDRLEATLGDATLRLGDSAVSIVATGGGAEVYVVRGQVPFSRGDDRGIARAGQRLILAGGREPETVAATLWDDWTGGLARPGPTDAELPLGMGVLEARVPDEVGMARWPLVVRRLDVRLKVIGALAITEVEQVFFNPASETVEGLYRARVPEQAVLQRFAVDRNGRMVDGYVREKAQAQAAYEAQVYRGSTDDPALLEWDSPGAYRARIYPIAAGETRRILVRYAEWLVPSVAGAPRQYRYPMGGGARAPHVQEFAFEADLSEAETSSLRAGMGAEIDGDRVLLRRSDFRPRADLWIELMPQEASERVLAYRAEHLPPPRAPGSRAVPNEADERDYWFLPFVLPESVLGDDPPSGIDLVIVADVSAATDRSHLELGRSVVESIVSHLDADDRLAIVASDLGIRSVDGAETAALETASADRVTALLDGLARIRPGGATDLGATLAEAAALIPEDRPGAVIYVGDGAPTVGELGADGLLEHMRRLPRPTRLYAIGIGRDANLELLEALSRGGGLARRVEERAEAADAALDVLGHVARPLAQRVTVELGNGIEHVFPRDASDVVIGEVLSVVGRVRSAPPSRIKVKGTILGRAFEQEFEVSTIATEQPTDLRLRWAGLRLEQLLLEGASREEVADLGTRYGLITPFTSFYVPSARELSQMGHAARSLDHQPMLGRRFEPPSAVGEAVARLALAPWLGAAALTGCDAVEKLAGQAGPGGSSEPSPTSTPLSEPEAQQANEEMEAAAEDGDNDGRRAQEAERSRGEEGRMRNAPAADQADPSSAGLAAGATAGEFAGDDGVVAEGFAQHVPRPSPAEPSDMAPPSAMRRARSAGSPDQPATEASTADAEEMAANSGNLGQLQGQPGSGLELRGTGRGGGGVGDGTIGLGDLGTIGHGAGGGTGSGYGRGSAAGPALPRVGQGRPEVSGALSAEVIRRVIRRHINEVRYCYERELSGKPDLQGRVTVNIAIGPTGAVQRAGVKTSTLANATVETCVTTAVQRWSFPSPDGGGMVMVAYPFDFTSGGSTQVVTTTRLTFVTPSHRPYRCSDAADLLLDDRRALWRERLAAVNGVSGWVDVYQGAIRQCEASRWRDRRALLDLMLARAGDIATMVRLYQFLSESSGRAYLRAAILRRVRTAADLRLVRDAFGTGDAVTWELVEQVLGRAQGPAARIRALKRLVQQFPQSFDLRLRLLEELEAANRGAEAMRLADNLRTDPLADAGVRTAIGEMFLRLGREADARRVFSEIVEFAPYDELARRRLGDLYRAHGWFEEAYRQYQTLLEIRPDDQTAILLLAQAAAGAGRIDEALRLEQRLAETSEPGQAEGIARTAILWSSVRFAKLRLAARANNDDERLAALLSRMRRSGVLAEAGAVRVSLTWSHPDAGLSLWTAYPGLGLTRPVDIAPEYGIEVLDVKDAEEGTYQVEVRRAPLGQRRDHLTAVDAELVIVWNEGQADEKAEVVPLRFEGDHQAFAYALRDRRVAEAPLSAEARAEAARANPSPAAIDIAASRGGAR